MVSGVVLCFPYHSRSDDNPDIIGRVADDVLQDTMILFGVHTWLCCSIRMVRSEDRQNLIRKAPDEIWRGSSL